MNARNVRKTDSAGLGVSYQYSYQDRSAALLGGWERESRNPSTYSTHSSCPHLPGKLLADVLKAESHTSKA